METNTETKMKKLNSGIAVTYIITELFLTYACKLALRLNNCKQRKSIPTTFVRHDTQPNDSHPNATQHLGAPTLCLLLDTIMSLNIIAKMGHSV
jgi:hypothetical protein